MAWLRNYGYFQKVELENILVFCDHCKTHGHIFVDCFIAHPALRKKLIRKIAIIDGTINGDFNTMANIEFNNHDNVIVNVDCRHVVIASDTSQEDIHASQHDAINDGINQRNTHVLVDSANVPIVDNLNVINCTLEFFIFSMFLHQFLEFVISMCRFVLFDHVVHHFHSMQPNCWLFSG